MKDNYQFKPGSLAWFFDFLNNSGWLSFKTSSLIFRPIVEGYTYIPSPYPWVPASEKFRTSLSNTNTGLLVLSGSSWFFDEFDDD
jgi:hypothetical protein